MKRVLPLTLLLTACSVYTREEDAGMDALISDANAVDAAPDAFLEDAFHGARLDAFRRTLWLFGPPIPPSSCDECQ